MKKIKNKALFCILAGLLCSGLTGCSHFPGAYTLPIEQGNDITQDQVNKLSVGMNEEQVRFLLGTPMIKDIFNTKRWDYVYYLSEKHQLKEKRHLAVFFEDGRVSRFTGDILPA